MLQKTQSTPPDTSTWMRAPKSPSPTSPRSVKPARRNDRWDQDSKWSPPKTTAAATMTPASSRPKRSNNKPVNYSDDDDRMDAAFSNWN